MSTLTERRYTTAETQRLAAVSYRQMDYWCRVGVFAGIPGFRPRPGSGVSRVWTRDHVHALTVCGRIADSFIDTTSREWPGRAPGRGVPTDALRRAVDCLIRHDFPLDGLLMVNAEEGLWSDDPDTIIDVLLSGPPYLVILLRPADRPC